MGIWKKYPRVEFCAYGTGEDEKACGDAQAAVCEGGGVTLFCICRKEVE